MIEDRSTVPTSAPELAEARARRGWIELRQRLRRVAPVDLARLLLFGAVGAGVLWLAAASWPALLPFGLGLFIAYLLLPIVNLLNYVMPRPLAAVLALISLLAVVIVVVGTLTPALTEQVVRLYNVAFAPEALEERFARFDAFLQSQPEPLRSLLRNYADQVGVIVQAQVDAFVAGLAESSVRTVMGLFSTLGFVLGLLLIPVWMLTLMIRQKQAAPAFRRSLPRWLEPDLWAVLRIVDRTLRNFISGQMVLGIAVGLLFYAALFLVGEISSFQLRYPVLVALLAALLQLLPRVGPLFAVVLFGSLSLANSWQTALTLIGLYLAVQIVVARLVDPRIQRRLTDINPAILVLFIATLGQFGLLWILLSAPAVAISRDLLRYALGRLSDPPRPAGYLPGDPLPVPPSCRKTRALRAGRQRSVPRSQVRKQRRQRAPLRMLPDIDAAEPGQ